MGLSIGEIRNSNKKYYYESYFNRVGNGWKWFWFSVIMIFLIQAGTYIVTRQILKQFYFREACFINTNGVEVVDWVDQQISFFPLSVTNVIILVVGLLLSIYAFVLHIKIESYRLYKYKFLSMLLTLGVFLIEVILIVFINIVSKNLSGMPCVVLISVYVLKIILIILSTGIPLPIEMKAPVKFANSYLLKVLNWLIDKSLKKL